MAGDFDPSVDHLIEPALTTLTDRLGSVTGLTGTERRALYDGAAAALERTIRLKVNRVLLLELNAARIRGELVGKDPHARWQEWKERSAEPEFWPSLAEHYPTMLSRLAMISENRCAAAADLARRFAADRDELGELPDGLTGELVRV
jgi:lantibiotic modifying enzyme